MTSGQQSLFPTRRHPSPRATSHLHVLVEEPSAEVVVRGLLERRFGRVGPTSWAVYTFQGKRDLLNKLAQRLRGLRRSLPPDGCVLVLVDRDDEPCDSLKSRMIQTAREAGLIPSSDVHDPSWNVAIRIVVEELEAWFWGDAEALYRAYPKITRDLHLKAPYRDPDAIKGGTWETLERELQRAGYFKGGLRKIEAATEIVAHMDPARNRSRSFQVFWATLDAMRSPAQP